MTFFWPTGYVSMGHPLATDENARVKGLQFLAMAKAASEGTSYSDVKKIFSDLYKHSHQQTETVKAFFQEIGLIYVIGGSGRLTLTQAGRQLYSLIGPVPKPSPSEDLKLKVDAILVWVLSKSQINRAQPGGSPSPSASMVRSCSIKPYATFWQAMRDLDGWIGMGEFVQELSHLHDFKDYDGTIDKIKQGRKANIQHALNHPDLGGKGSNGNYRIYWRTHLTVGGEVLDYDDQNHKFTFRPDRLDLLNAILDTLKSGARRDFTLELNAIIKSEDWVDLASYYDLIGGVQCPPYLTSGQMKLMMFEEQEVVDLSNYNLKLKEGLYSVVGGAELCRLPPKAPCFHQAEPNRLLRLDKKIYVGGASVHLFFGAGRPIIDQAELAKHVKAI
jgi:hypothetical protein